MFEELEAKRVCRNDLRSSSPFSSEPDEEAQDILRSRLSKLFGPITTTERSTHIDIETASDKELQEDGAEEGFEFRLFATNNDTRSASGLKVSRVILENDDQTVDREGGFLIPWRNSRYFFTGQITPLERRRFELAAVSGEDIQRGLLVRHTGLEVPWRVSVIKQQVSRRKISEAKDVGIEDENHPTVGKRKRMGKKMRILHRKREKIRKELLLLEQEKLASKAAAEREKKTKRNKEKQLKKRAKEKAKKAGQVDVVMGED